MMQVLLRTMDARTGRPLWSCVAARPPSNAAAGPVLREELLDALVEALDGGQNPMLSLMRAGAEMGEMYIAAPDIFCVSAETLTNVFTPLAVLPLDDAALVASEMAESIGDQIEAGGRRIILHKVPDTVDYPRLACSLASGDVMLKWW
jgi:hypothetical protein